MPDSRSEGWRLCQRGPIRRQETQLHGIGRVDRRPRTSDAVYGARRVSRGVQVTQSRDAWVDWFRGRAIRRNGNAVDSGEACASGGAILPKITKQHYASTRIGRLSRKPMMEYDYTGCSECSAEVHPTAKSCPKCGATFTGKPAKLSN